MDHVTPKSRPAPDTSVFDRGFSDRRSDRKIPPQTPFKSPYSGQGML